MNSDRKADRNIGQEYQINQQEALFKNPGGYSNAK
jgi:hypothetical protein